MVAVTRDGEVFLWSTVDGELLLHSAPATGGDLSSNADALVALGSSGHLAVWCTDSVYRLWTGSGELLYTARGETPSIGASRVCSLVVTPSGWVASSVFGTVRVRDGGGGRVVRELPTSAGPGVLALTPGGRQLLCRAGSTTGRWCAHRPGPWTRSPRRRTARTRRTRRCGTRPGTPAKR